MIFPDAELQELSGSGCYRFASVEPVYRSVLEYLNGFFEFSRVRRTINSGTPDGKSALVWEVINEAWWQFGRLNAEVPIYWIALSKKILEEKIVPVNVFMYCKAIVGGFDLAKYQERCALPDYDFLRLTEDVPAIKKLLETYADEDLLPPISELDWEDHDCVPAPE